MVEKIHCFWQVLLTEKYHKQATKNICIKECNCCQLMLEIFVVATMSICSIYLIKTILNNNQTEVITISKYMMVTWHIINFGLEKKKSKVQNWLMEKILECHVTFKLHIHTMPCSNHHHAQCLTATATMHHDEDNPPDDKQSLYNHLSPPPTAHIHMPKWCIKTLFGCNICFFFLLFFLFVF